MSVIINPSNLRLAKAEIIKLMPDKADGFKYKNPERLKELIEKIVSQETDRIEKYTKLLKEDEITAVCNYVSLNIYNVSLKNLLKVIEFGASSTDMGILYSDWQNNYDRENSKEIRRFMISASEKDNRLNSALNSFDCSTETVNKWIKSNRFIDNITDIIGQKKSITDADKALIENGIIFNTKLFLECRRRYYLCCSRESYLNISDKELSTAFSNYTYDEKFKMVANFVKKLSFPELLKYELFLLAINDFANNNTKNSLLDYLEKYSLKDKYLNWYNYIILKHSLDIRRFNFWANYIGDNKAYFDSEHTLYIDFGDYLITEFKGKAAGPSYLFTKEEFKKYNIVNKIKYWSKSKIQSYLHDLYEKDDVKVKMIHQGEWEYDFRRRLRNYNILPTNK